MENGFGGGAEGLRRFLFWRGKRTDNAEAQRTLRFAEEERVHRRVSRVAAEDTEKRDPADERRCSTGLRVNGARLATARLGGRALRQAEGQGFPLWDRVIFTFGLRFVGAERRVGLWLGACLPK